VKNDVHEARRTVLSIHLFPRRLKTSFGSFCCLKLEIIEEKIISADTTRETSFFNIPSKLQDVVIGSVLPNNIILILLGLG